MEVNYLTDVIDDLQPRLSKVEADLQVKNNENQKLSTELLQTEDALANLSKEKKRIDQTNVKLMEQVHHEENKNIQLNKVRLELQRELALAEDGLQKGIREKAELNQSVKRQENELKTTQVRY